MPPLPGNPGNPDLNSGRFVFGAIYNEFGTFPRKATSNFKQNLEDATRQPKASPRGPRTAKGSPRAPQREPKGVQGHPKGSQREPKAPQREPKGAQGHPKGSQGPKSRQRKPKAPQRHPREVKGTRTIFQTPDQPPMQTLCYMILIFHLLPPIASLTRLQAPSLTPLS